MTALALIALVVLFLAWKVAKVLAIVFLVSLVLCAWVAVRMGLAVFGVLVGLGAARR